jgi:hypothetical protein
MLIGLSTLILAGAAAQSLTGATMYVAVKSADLKTSTGLFAGKAGTLGYGSQVTVLQESGKMVQVRSIQPALTGWVTTSSLTSKRIVSSGGTATASTKELALAGKGFSEEVEQNYKTADNLDYTQVDAMEQISVAGDQLLQFLTEGHLATGE